METGRKRRIRTSVIIPTYSRAEELKSTLSSFAELSPKDPWELIVVDNNSKDNTREVVKDAAAGVPVELRYIFEKEQGRCAALNTGILAANGEIILTTDDDVRREPDWIDAAADSLDSLRCDYLGGKVIPVWGAPR